MNKRTSTAKLHAGTITLPVRVPFPSATIFTLVFVGVIKFGASRTLEAVMATPDGAASVHSVAVDDFGLLDAKLKVVVISVVLALASLRMYVSPEVAVVMLPALQKRGLKGAVVVTLKIVSIGLFPNRYWTQ